jgi:uncharacterized caspase-like protein
MSNVFALLVGIDTYKSGSIWNLNSCASDVSAFKRYLTNTLSVPRTHIRTLLDGAATLRHIEDVFVSHLVNNPQIQHGDTLIVYFAGHGSRVSTPAGWSEEGSPNTDVLCTYDFDTVDEKGDGRVAGLSNRSMHALLRELAESKGDNITLVLDCSFSPPTHQNP